MPESPSKASTRVIRSDIQALRTIAVSLVVLFHLWPNRMPGGFIGVDIFFVISGFLITKHILNEVQYGRFSVTSFWSRRIKRLLPASFFVLLITGLGIFLIAPVSQWGQWFGEIQSAVFYFENWNLAGAAVDYLALANQASPVQHFWSLSAEEQFYFVWPLIVAAAIYLSARRASSNRRMVVFSTLLTVTVITFVFGVYYTFTEPAIAYFSTPVRAWEFGAGALAVFHKGIRSLRFKSFLAGAGLAGIFFSSLAINTKTPFPGLAALLPVLSTVAIILAFVESGFFARVFAFRPIQWVGDKSYAIYLWHWPILILAPLALHGAPTLVNKLGLLAMTLVLSWLTQEFLEAPFAKISPPKWKIFAVAATISVFIYSMSGLAIQLGNEQINQSLQSGKTGQVSSQACFGAAARAPGQEPCVNTKIKGVYPTVATAPSDIPVLPESCFSVTREQVAASYCALGDRGGSKRIAAIGDSHIAHYAGALNALALKNHWQVDLYAKGGCPFSYAVRVHDAVLTKNCPKWVENVVVAVEEKKYDAIVTSQRAGVDWVGGNSQATLGLAQLWQQLIAEGNHVVAIKDNPSPGVNVVNCLLEAKACSFPRESSLVFDPQIQAFNSVPKVRLMNFDDIYCNAAKCFPVIGNAVVYRDDNHLTDTFARTLAPFMDPVISDAIANK